MEKIAVEAVADKVEVLIRGQGPTSAMLTVADTWNICQELGSAARQAQQHTSKQQAADAGVRTSAAPKIGRQPED